MSAAGELTGTAGFEQLKLLFDYTAMHIGLYTAIAGIFAASIAAKEYKLKVNHRWMWAAIFFICAAGFAGGIVASSIPHFPDMWSFWNGTTGPFFAPHLVPVPWWASAEHSFFWLGVACAAVAVATGK